MDLPVVVFDSDECTAESNPSPDEGMRGENGEQTVSRRVGSTRSVALRELDQGVILYTIP